MKGFMSVEHPDYYKEAEATVEPIVLCSKFGFCFGNFIKYVLRAGKKGPELDDLKKALYYLNAAVSDPAGWEQCAGVLKRERPLVEAYGNVWLNSFYSLTATGDGTVPAYGYECPRRVCDGFSRYVRDIAEQTRGEGGR